MVSGGRRFRAVIIEEGKAVYWIGGKRSIPVNLPQIRLSESNRAMRGTYLTKFILEFLRKNYLITIKQVDELLSYGLFTDLRKIPKNNVEKDEMINRGFNR